MFSPCPQVSTHLPPPPLTSAFLPGPRFFLSLFVSFVFCHFTNQQSSDTRFFSCTRSEKRTKSREMRKMQGNAPNAGKCVECKAIGQHCHLHCSSPPSSPSAHPHIILVSWSLFSLFLFRLVLVLQGTDQSSFLNSHQKTFFFQNPGRQYKGTQMIIIFFNCLYLYQFDFIILSDKCFSSRSGALYQCPLSSYTEDCQQASPSTNCISRSNNILIIAAGRDWRAPAGRWSLWWAGWGSAAATSAHRDQGGPVAWGSCHQPGWDNWAFVAGVGWKCCGSVGVNNTEGTKWW